MNLEFTVNQQVLSRKDYAKIVNKNRNIYQCKFSFENSEWTTLHKFALFRDGWGNRETVYLGKDSDILTCIIPAKVLQGTYFKVSVYGGDLMTTNSVTIYLTDSDYSGKHHGGCDNHRKDIFVEIFDRLDSTIDSIAFSDNCLHLFNRDVLIESVYLPYASETSLEKLMQDLEDFKENITDKVPTATDTSNGLMSSYDKMKLDLIEPGANRTIVDTDLDPDSNNPISNKVVTEALGTKIDDVNLVDKVDSLLLELINME